MKYRTSKGRRESPSDGARVPQRIRRRGARGESTRWVRGRGHTSVRCVAIQIGRGSLSRSPASRLARQRVSTWSARVYVGSGRGSGPREFGGSYARKPRHPGRAPDLTNDNVLRCPADLSLLPEFPLRGSPLFPAPFSRPGVRAAFFPYRRKRLALASETRRTIHIYAY
jgi:hypothetical protein